MESPQLKIQPKVEQLASKTSTRLPDKQQLLLLGLQLLNKGLKLPTAVVQPQVQRQTATKQTPPSPPSVTQLKKPSPLPNSPVKSVSSDDESDKEEGVRSPTVVIGRKRKRNSNDDLSEVEKREKRKMMNRVAAQNARDRKKAYVEDLERRVAMLEDKNKQLVQENTTLKQRTTTLTEEKSRLEKRLADSIQSDLQQALVMKGCLEDPAIGSAVPDHVSPQQKQIPKALLFQVWMSLSLSFWLSSLKKASPNIDQQLATLPDLDLDWSHGSHVTSSLTDNSNSQYLLREEPWWGASESEWNPPRN